MEYNILAFGGLVLTAVCVILLLKLKKLNETAEHLHKTIKAFQEADEETMENYRKEIRELKIRINDYQLYVDGLVSDKDDRLERAEQEISEIKEAMETHDAEIDKDYEKFMEGVSAIMNYSPEGKNENFMS